MILIALLFHSCPELWFPDVETNLDPLRSVPAVCRILCISVMCGACLGT